MVQEWDQSMLSVRFKEVKARKMKNLPKITQRGEQEGKTRTKKTKKRWERYNKRKTQQGKAYKNSKLISQQPIKDTRNKFYVAQVFKLAMKKNGYMRLKRGN